MAEQPERPMPGSPASIQAVDLMRGMNSAFEYWVDAWQRSILLIDVLRQRGNNYVEHSARKAPHVLTLDRAGARWAHAATAGKLRAGPNCSAKGHVG